MFSPCGTMCVFEGDSGVKALPGRIGEGPSLPSSSSSVTLYACKEAGHELDPTREGACPTEGDSCRDAAVRPWTGERGFPGQVVLKQRPCFGSHPWNAVAGGVHAWGGHVRTRAPLFCVSKSCFHFRASQRLSLFRPSVFDVLKSHFCSFLVERAKM